MPISVEIDIAGMATAAGEKNAAARDKKRITALRARQSALSHRAMTTISLTDFQPTLCFQPSPRPGEPMPRGRFVQVICRDGTFLTLEQYFRRAAGMST